MILTLTLSNDVETRLLHEAERRGATVDKLASELIERSLPVPANVQETLNMLEDWQREDESLSEDEMQHHRAVLKTIDTDRTSDRKLFERVLSEN